MAIAIVLVTACECFVITVIVAHRQLSPSLSQDHKEAASSQTNDGVGLPVHFHAHCGGWDTVCHCHRHRMSLMDCIKQSRDSADSGRPENVVTSAVGTNVTVDMVAHGILICKPCCRFFCCHGLGGCASRHPSPSSSSPTTFTKKTWSVLFKAFVGRRTRAFDDTEDDDWTADAQCHGCWGGVVTVTQEQ